MRLVMCRQGLRKHEICDQLQLLLPLGMHVLGSPPPHARSSVSATRGRPHAAAQLFPLPAMRWCPQPPSPLPSRQLAPAPTAARVRCCQAAWHSCGLQQAGCQMEGWMSGKCPGDYLLSACQRLHVCRPLMRQAGRGAAHGERSQHGARLADVQPSDPTQMAPRQ